MNACLTLEDGAAIPSSYTLQDDETISLGRGLHNAVVLNNKCASKQHATIYAVGKRWFIRDLDSHNGVVVNGLRIKGEVELPADAQIILGEVTFRFSIDEPVAGAWGSQPKGRKRGLRPLRRAMKMKLFYASTNCPRYIISFPPLLVKPRRTDWSA